MAMRDPGTPRRNPFFDHEPDAPELGGGADPGGWQPPWPGVDTSAVGTLLSLVDALAQAQPEAGEHLVAAAHELVLAVKTVVDAAEAALAAQRAAHDRADEAQATDEDRDPLLRDEAPPAGAAGVRRIDLA